MAAESKEVIQKGSAENALVETAYNKLSEIISTYFEGAMIAAGEYLLKEFYDDNIELARKKESPKDESLNQLIKRLQNSSSKSASKSWIYQSVALVVQSHDIEKTEKESFQTYGKLFLSHKVSLLTVKDMDIKKKLIKEIFEKNLSVRDLKERKEELKGPTVKATNYFALLNHPEEITSKYNRNVFSLNSLNGLNPKKLDFVKQKTAKKCEEFQNKIDKFKYETKKHRDYIKQYNKFMSNIEQALQSNGTKKKKKIGGFQEWTESKNNVNICTGCSNDCKYCYAKSMAYRFKQVQEGQWVNEIIRQKDIDEQYKLYDGRVGFPTSHDITPSNLDVYIQVLNKLLSFGNKILIVSKPNLECIKRICDEAAEHKDKILFRFSIGAMDDAILSFWDTNAPLYEERKESLKYAFENGFQTSVSMEPLLDSAKVVTTASDLVQYVTDFIWIGKMNHLNPLTKKAKENNDQPLLDQISVIESGQTNDKIKAIYADFQKSPEVFKKLKWKDSFKKVLGIKSPKKAGMDI